MSDRHTIIETEQGWHVVTPRGKVLPPYEFKYEAEEDAQERNRQDELTLFDLSEFDAPDEEPTIERYVVVVADADGKSYWRRKKRTSHYDPLDEFIELDMTPPMPGNQKTLNMTARIPVKGVKLPTMFKSARGARSKVSDLYRRHKGGGEGINMWIQKWERKESDKFWKPVDAFK